jgi:RNA polymerase subunit RPABC4/transcription elongation factor Spt4
MTATCARCSSTIDADRNVCPVCFFGEGLKSDTVECTKCHSELDDDARFCPQCGAMAPAETAVAGDRIRTALTAKLASQYRIVRLLGRGGMGSVYLARDLTLDREVAIKVVKTADDSREIYDRFRREARTAAKLSHPNIVPLHAFGEVEGMPYFVMGYVRGESLADRLRRDGKLSEEEARRIFVEIADALDHAHRQGVVHRDVKPDNVLLEDESGRALLTDFGVAKAVDTGEPLTVHGSVIGTPHYMSPEQATGRSDIDGRSDIYSLGVMTYAMLAGRLPFEGKTASEILAKHLNQEAAPLRSFAPTVSDSTVHALERCLAKDPAERWPDARSLKLALGISEESQLPDALHAAESRGIPALAIAYALTLLYALLLGGQPEGLFVAVSNPALAVLLYLFVVARLQRQGFSRKQSQSVIWREPVWWLWWYPRALRRRGNIWERLPVPVRYLRWSVFAFVAYMIALETLFCFMGIDSGGSFLANPRRHPISFSIHMGFLAAFVVMGALLVVRTRRELKRNGLAAADIDRVILSMPPSRASFWARPHIAAILAPAKLLETGRRSESPHDHVQSILRQADELSGPLRPLGAQAAIAARQLVASIDHADREIADLARNVEPGEEERLTDKIETLSGDESAPMRTLLEKQLELIRALSARIEEARERRNRRVELLGALALHVASLRARVTETPSEIRQISDNVRALCDDIGRQAMALDTIAAGGDDAMATIARKAR